MPDNDKVIFGAEFDDSIVTKGADAVIGKLQELKNHNDALAQSTEVLKVEMKNLAQQNKEYNAVISTSASNVQKLEREQAKLNLTTSEGSARNREIKKEIQELSREQIDYQKIITTNADKIDQYNSRIKTNTVAIAENKASIKAFEGQLTSLGQSTEKANLSLNGAYGTLRKIAYVLPGIGVGGLVALLADPLIELGKAILNLDPALTSLQKDQAAVSDIMQKANKEYSTNYAHLELIRGKLTDLSIPENERLKLLKEYNKTADANNKIDAAQVDNLQQINEKIDQQIYLLKERALARASESVIGEKADALFNAQLQARQDAENRGVGSTAITIADQPNKELLSLGDTVTVFDKKSGKLKKVILRQADVDAFAKDRKGIHEKIMGYEREGAIERAVEADERVKNAQEDFDRAIKLGLKFTTAEGLTTVSGQKEKAAPENVFLQKLSELRAKLAAASASEFQSEPLILAKFKAELEKEFQSIAQLVKEKKLTIQQGDILKGIISQINSIDLSKSLDEFHKKQRDALEKITDAIITTNIEESNRRIANIRDNLEREKAEIEASFEATVSLLKKKFDELNKQISDDQKKGLLSPAQAKENRLALFGLFGGLLDDAEVARTNKQLDLAFNSFQETIKEKQRLFSQEDVGDQEFETKLVEDLTNKFLTNQIGYEKYQKELTKLQQTYSLVRKKERLAELNDELDAINTQISKTTDAESLKKLKDQQTSVRGAIATVRQDIAKDEAGGQEKSQKEWLTNLQKWSKAYTEVLSSVLNFWGQVNQAEAQSLDRSIALQNLRVQNAKDIADKGNAEYLEQEQKRLDALQLKREDDARKQIAINNALTLSQATVAAITAIAKAAQSGDPFEAIAAVAAVIGAIAAAYSFVSSLQPQVPTFYEGTEYVQGAGRPLGKDTVPARLHIGERVVTSKDNSEYWDSLHAIHNHLIPPGVLNSFVAGYPLTAVPMVDYDRLTEATQNKMGYDSFEVIGKLEELNGTMAKVHHAISSLGIQVDLDEEGFSIQLEKSVRHRKLLKRS